jgi:hypothetical protein
MGVACGVFGGLMKLDTLATVTFTTVIVSIKVFICYDIQKAKDKILDAIQEQNYLLSKLKKEDE